MSAKLARTCELRRVDGILEPVIPAWDEEMSSVVADPEVLGEPWKSSETQMSASNPLENCVIWVAPQTQHASLCYRFVAAVEFGMSR